MKNQQERPERTLEIMQPVQSELMPMPVTSDEESSMKNQTRTDVNTVYLDEEMS